MSELTGWAIFMIEGRNLAQVPLEASLGLKADLLREGRSGMRFWQLNSRLSGSSSLSQHVEDILIRLLPARRSVRSLPNGLEAKMICTVVRQKNERASFQLPGRLLLLIGALHCQLEVYFDVADVGDEH